MTGGQAGEDVARIEEGDEEGGWPRGPGQRGQALGRGCGIRGGCRNHSSYF